MQGRNKKPSRHTHTEFLIIGCYNFLSADDVIIMIHGVKDTILSVEDVTIFHGVNVINLESLNVLSLVLGMLGM